MTEATWGKYLSVCLSDQQPATCNSHLVIPFDNTTILYSTWKKEKLFSLNNFSSWYTALCCMCDGWRADESRSTLPKMGKAACTVVHIKIPNLVSAGAAYWCRLFICTLKSWIYCYTILYTLQNGSRILWGSSHSSGFPSSVSCHTTFICSCLLITLTSSYTCSSHIFGDLDLFSSIGASLTPPLLQFWQ